jgi:hypothetical protein
LENLNLLCDILTVVLGYVEIQSVILFIIDQRFKSQRIRNSREFFEVDVLDAISTIRGIAVDTLEEEINSKYIALVDEVEKRRLSQKLAEERAEEQRYEELQKFRYENFLEQNQC